MTTRNYAGAAYYNLYGDLPPTWDWLATRHLVKLPEPLNLEDCRLVDDGVSQVDTEDACCSNVGQPSSFSASVNPLLTPQTQKFPKPPPPIHPADASPSPSKSHGAFKGSPSRGSSSWDGNWQSGRIHPWDWNTRRWR